MAKRKPIRSYEPKGLSGLARARAKVESLAGQGVKMNWDKASETALEARFRYNRSRITKPLRSR